MPMNTNRRAESHAMPIKTVSLVVKFWVDEGVWNAVAEALPVAVYGETFEGVSDRLRAAILEHLEVVCELGLLPEVVTHLQAAASAKHAVEDAEPGELLGQLVAPLPVPADCHPA